MSKNLVSIILAIVILLGGSFGLWCFWTTDQGVVYYGGAEVFPTEEAYREFKLAFVDPEMQLMDVSVLSSEPPIIVGFEAKTSNFDYEFPYGERSIDGWVTKGGGGISGFVLFCFLLLFFTFLPIWAMHSRFNE